MHFRHDGGSFDMTIFDVDVTYVAKLGSAVSGHPFVTSVSCEAHVGSVDMHFHGGARYDRNSGIREMTGGST